MGHEAHLDTLFAGKGTITAASRDFVFRYKSPAHWLEISRTYYGPVLKAFAAVRAEARQALKADLYALLDKLNAAEDDTLVVPSEYLQVIITKRS